MKVDGASNLDRCGPGGLPVFLPDATSAGVIKPPEVVASFARGDDDMGSICLAASTPLPARTKTPGLALF